MCLHTEIQGVQVGAGRLKHFLWPKPLGPQVPLKEFLQVIVVICRCSILDKQISMSAEHGIRHGQDLVDEILPILGPIHRPSFQKGGQCLAIRHNYPYHVSHTGVFSCSNVLEFTCSISCGFGSVPVVSAV